MVLYWCCMSRKCGLVFLLCVAMWLQHSGPKLSLSEALQQQAALHCQLVISSTLSCTRRATCSLPLNADAADVVQVLQRQHACIDVGHVDGDASEEKERHCTAQEVPLHCRAALKKHSTMVASTIITNVANPSSWCITVGCAVAEPITFTEARRPNRAGGLLDQHCLTGGSCALTMPKPVILQHHVRSAGQRHTSCSRQAITCNRRHAWQSVGCVIRLTACRPWI